SFELKLRDDVVFSDGTTKFNAEVVKTNLDRLKTVNGPQTSDLSNQYESTEIVDDHTVIVHLSGPNPDLERIFSQLIGMMVNPTALAANEEGIATNPAGSGPYVLDEANTVVNDTYQFVKNEHYWDADAYPYQKLWIKTYADQNAMLTALQSGVVSIGYGSADTVKTAEGFGLKVVTAPVNVSWLALNDRKGEVSPALGKQEVRQALNMAVNRDEIVEAIFKGQAKPTVQVFPEGTPGYDASLNNRYPYDPVKAKQMIADAGYPEGFTFTAGLAFPDRDTLIAEILASYFADIGVTMSIEPMPGGAWNYEDHMPFASVIHAMGGQGAYSDAQLLLKPSQTIWNPRGTTNSEFDALWEKGTNTTDAAERIKTYQELSKLVVEEAWFVPLAGTNAIYFYDADVITSAEFVPQITVPRMYTWTYAK
ncbi:MAG: ABC transporter substrate-binding protein, partial [Microbacteriaceae bacterium]